MDQRRSQSFLCKKWSLFAISLFGISSAVVIASIVSNQVDSYNRNYSSNYTTIVKSVDKNWIMAAIIISFPLELLGLLGALKEDFCLTMTYAILMTLRFLIWIPIAIETPSYWCYTILSLITCVSAYAFAGDLHILRNSMFSTPVFVSSAQPQNVVYINRCYTNQLRGQMRCQQFLSEPGERPYPPPPYDADSYDSRINLTSI